ncbi:Cytidine and deoxycytidylate deaminase zinc-binding region [Seminavis robusta]|uniref:Cytidine and deoxycytidylate deaminase zinc-binding region n=1 Tax=Seminavis robusta TaxID=568900 RepID=A0A9N8DQC4_9STRA|nr:Cytidine and deoxycytidylate deaminase zinc-binding region [Seminavis robusta]|eukprot:Sro276_g106100.1 Cytidine and deoxycytidylate deaminase zinc-binding region (227) ;mRNA; f:69155-69967
MCSTSNAAEENRMEGVVLDAKTQKAPLTATAAELKRMFEVIEKEILPVTTEGVAKGNKVFGASILNKDLSTVTVGTNAETECPLFHGEVKCIYEWSKVTCPSARGPAAQEAVFLSTHEPCCMCISSILWSGFTKVYYFFPYTVTAAQGIPHDINTMHELWGVNTYRKRNKYMSTICLIDLVKGLEDSDDKKELEATVERLLASYDTLSNKYHTEKSNNADNSLVLG